MAKIKMSLEINTILELVKGGEDVTLRKLDGNILGSYVRERWFAFNLGEASKKMAILKTNDDGKGDKFGMYDSNQKAVTEDVSVKYGDKFINSIWLTFEGPLHYVKDDSVVEANEVFKLTVEERRQIVLNFIENMDKDSYELDFESIGKVKVMKESADFMVTAFGTTLLENPETNKEVVFLEDFKANTSMFNQFVSQCDCPGCKQKMMDEAKGPIN